MGSPLRSSALSSSSSSSEGEQHPQTYEAAISYLRAIKETNKDIYHAFLKITKDFTDNRIGPIVVIARAKELFKGDPSLILGFNTFLPKGFEITLPTDDGIVQNKPARFEIAINFLKKIKMRVQNDNVYKQFIEIMQLYKKESMTETELYQEVAIIFRDYHDLLDEFSHFLPEESTLHNAPLPGKRCRDDKTSDPTSHPTQRDTAAERFDNASHQGICGDKYIPEPISKLDLSNCKRCTPSYRLLPENYSMPITSGRSKLATEVLNDRWVSVDFGTEDFLPMEKNQYEENLFRCEDDRFELDWLIESVRSTIKRAEELLNKIKDDTIKLDSPICIKDHFTAIHLRCIERIYEENKLDMLDLDLLYKNAAVSLPNILIHLKHIEEESVRCRSNSKKVWAEIYAKNHKKLLHHRRFNFKQQDKRSSSSKGVHSRQQGVDGIEDASQAMNQELHNCKAENCGQVALAYKPSSSSSGDNNILVEQGRWLRPRLSYGEKVEGNSYNSSQRAHKIDSLCHSTQHGKTQNDVCKADDMLRTGKDAE